MTTYYKMKRSWFNSRKGSTPLYESYRHRLARLGIKTRGMKGEEMQSRYIQAMEQKKKQKSFTGIKESDRDTLSLIMEFEGGNPTRTEYLTLMSRFVKSGQAWTLQGMYGRQALALIDAGVLTKKGDINWSKVDDPDQRLYSE